MPYLTPKPLPNWPFIEFFLLILSLSLCFAVLPVLSGVIGGRRLWIDINVRGLAFIICLVYVLVVS